MQKICITSQGNDLNSLVDLRFGRAAFFLFLNEKGKIEKVIENPGNLAPRGAGVVAAQTVINEGVVTVITGNVGPNAFMVLSQSGTKIFLAPPNSTVKEAFSLWKKHKLEEVKELQPRGFRRGMGRGFGRRWNLS